MSSTSLNADSEKSISTSTSTGTGADDANAVGAAPAKDAKQGRAARERAAAQQGKAGAAGAQAADGAELFRAREVGASETTVAWHATGGGGSGRRLLLIALDGATPELALGAWRGQLRTFALLSERGVYGQLRSGTPWDRFSSNLSLFSGLNQGQLGIYGAEQRPNRNYAAPLPADSRTVRASRLWELLSRQGYSVGVVNAPASTPPAALNGHLLAGNLAPGEFVAAPAPFARQVAQWLADEPELPPSGDALDRVVGLAYTQSERRFRIARRMLARENYDCFVLCDDGIAQVQRLLWHTIDVSHLRHTPDQPLADTISAFYRFISDQIGELLELVDDNTVIAVVSASGAQPLDGELALNDWLIAEGELRLRSAPSVPSPLAECDVDWAATRAWAGANGAIYLNIAGREPAGCVPAEQADQLLASLTARLHALRSPLAPASDSALLAAYQPEALYGSAQGIAPDLLAICSQPGWRTNALAGHASPWLSARSHALDAACDSPRGMFAIYDPQNPAGGRLIEGTTIFDILPTLLELFDTPAPARARGRALLSKP